MMKNKHLPKAIAEQNFYCFQTKLSEKCKRHNIELRAANQFFPLSFFPYLFSLIEDVLELWGYKVGFKEGFEARI
jgi:hypothetical protein